MAIITRYSRWVFIVKCDSMCKLAERAFDNKRKRKMRDVCTNNVIFIYICDFIFFTRVFLPFFFAKFYTFSQTPNVIGRTFNFVRIIFCIFYE